MLVVLLFSFLLGACNTYDYPTESFNDMEEYVNEDIYEGIQSPNDYDSYETEYYPPNYETTTTISAHSDFETAMTEYVTDVVIARYVSHSQLGGLTVIEFSVSERLLGDAADSILVYTDDLTMKVGFAYDDMYNDCFYADFTFRPDVDYLLPLAPIDSPYMDFHEDGFTFVTDIIIDLDNPLNSVMFGEPLYRYSMNLRLGDDTTREDIIVYVYELVKDNVATPRTIRSNNIKDIINGSPYVTVVEIGEPIRLASDLTNSDWGLTDLYRVTIIESLTGNASAGDPMVILFHAYTVFPGERHIVASRPLAEGDYWHSFTSRYSLFHMDQLDEIISILNGN